MAYSDKIHSKSYSHLIIWNITRKMVSMIGAPVLLVMILWQNQVIPVPAAIAAGVVLAGILFWLLQIGRMIQPDWDGEIVGNRNRIERKTIDMLAFGDEVTLNRIGSMNPSYSRQMRCTFTVRRDRDGRLFKYRYIDRLDEGYDAAARYFRPGDRVRHHRGLPLFEKEDTSRDKRLLCLNCRRFSDKAKERCHHCGMPMLK